MNRRSLAATKATRPTPSRARVPPRPRPGLPGTMGLLLVSFIRSTPEDKTLAKNGMHHRDLVVYIDFLTCRPGVKRRPVHALALNSKDGDWTADFWMPLVGNETRVLTAHQALTDAIHTMV
jgi:hypothetical protein